MDGMYTVPPLYEGVAEALLYSCIAALRDLLYSQRWNRDLLYSQLES